MATDDDADDDDDGGACDEKPGPARGQSTLPLPLLVMHSDVCATIAPPEHATTLQTLVHSLSQQPALLLLLLPSLMCETAAAAAAAAAAVRSVAVNSRWVLVREEHRLLNPQTGDIMQGGGGSVDGAVTSVVITRRSTNNAASRKQSTRSKENKCK